MRRSSFPRRLGYALVVVMAAGLALPAPARAQARERILGYDVDLHIDQTGALLVTERIDYDFGGAQRHGIFRDVPVRFRHDDRYDRVYRINVLEVSGSPGTPTAFDLSNQERNLRIKIGDPDQTISGRHGYTISYRVTGALNGFTDHDELYWNAVGAQWAIPVEQASVRLAAPAAIDRVACYAGPQGATTPCRSSRADGRTAVFTATGLGPAEALTVVAAFPSGTVPGPRPILDERWTMASAFSATPATLGMAAVIAALLAGALLLLVARWHRVRSRADATSSGAVPPPPPVGAGRVEPAPPDGLRPAQLGLVVGKEVAPVAVSATIVDLAVRGYLRVEELPTAEDGGRLARRRPDWRLVKLKEAGGDLDRYEHDLVADLFRLAEASDGDGGAAADDGGLATVELSKLKRQFHQQFAHLQGTLYDDGVRRGWFVSRPDEVIRGWRWIGAFLAVVGAALTIAAAWLTHAGLVPLPVVLVGLALLLGARRMPSRTLAGRALARRVQGFRTYLTMPGLSTAGAEAADLFAPYLPYAIVLGLARQWTLAFAGRDLQPETAWYQGRVPVASSAGDSGMDGFARSSASSLTSSPLSVSSSAGASGFGGDGSGGGGGGGGGGSW